MLARILDQANKEQLLRLVGEYNVLASRDNLHLPRELGAAFEALVHSATQRLGLPMQKIQQ
jgi:hypothetical protein